MTDCADEVSGIYKAMAFVNTSKRHAYWFMFFADLFYCNKDLKAFGDIWEEFDFNNDDSILYRMCERDELIRWAVDKHLRTEKGKGFFKDKLLNKFYAMWRDFQGSMRLVHDATKQGLVVEEVHNEEEVQHVEEEKGGEEGEEVEKVEEV